MVRVSVSAIDGSLQEWDEADDIVTRLLVLQRDGLRGRALVDQLITDDWAAPPLTVKISGTTLTGVVVCHVIGCG
jgi:hypothetical protein